MKSIREFGETLLKHGGPSKGNAYEVLISKEGDDIRFFALNVDTPTLDLTVSETTHETGGHLTAMPVSMNPTTINITFLVDDEHYLPSYFHRWFNEVVPYGSSHHKTLKFRYFEEYVRDIEIRILNRSTDVVAIYRCKDAFPTQVGAIAYSWSNVSGYATLAVNFAIASIETETQFITATDRGVQTQTESLNSNLTTTTL